MLQGRLADYHRVKICFCTVSAGPIIMFGQLLQFYFLPPEPCRAWSEWQVSFQP